MNTQRIATAPAPSVTVLCHGDVELIGWDEATLLVKGDEPETTETEKGYSVVGHGDLKLRMPRAASVTFTAVHGDLIVKHIEGDIRLEEAMGDTVLRDVGVLSIGRVHGDLVCRDVSGSLDVAEVMGDSDVSRAGALQGGRLHGDAAVRYANGDVDLETVMGDASLKVVNGDVRIGLCHRDVNLRDLGGHSMAKAQGDIRLRGGLAAGKHTFDADGDIVVRWPTSTPLSIVATAAEVVDRLGLEEVVRQNGSTIGRLGDGETTLILESRGRIILKGIDAWDNVKGEEAFDAGDFDVDLEFEGLGKIIGSEIDSRVSLAMSRLEQKFGPEFARKMEEKTRKVAARAEREAERALRQAERASRQSRWHARHRGWAPPSPPAPPSAKEKKVTEEEQLRILQMVEKGVITPDEADALLQALSG